MNKIFLVLLLTVLVFTTCTKGEDEVAKNWHSLAMLVDHFNVAICHEAEKKNLPMIFSYHYSNTDTSNAMEEVQKRFLTRMEDRYTFDSIEISGMNAIYYYMAPGDSSRYEEYIFRHKPSNRLISVLYYRVDLEEHELEKPLWINKLDSCFNEPY